MSEGHGRSLLDFVRRFLPDQPAPALEAAAADGARALDGSALSALGLSGQPFHDHAPAGDLFADAAIEMQVNALAQQLRSGEMIPLLKGERGAGKTSQLIQLMGRTGEEFHYFVVRGRDGATAERTIIDMLRLLVARVPDDTGTCFRELARQLRSLVADGSPAALVVDDADTMPDRELNRLLAARDRLDSALGGRFRLLLAVQPEFELRMEQLTSSHLDAGRVSGISVRPLQRPRIGPYLEHRLRAAGLRGAMPLDDDDLDRIAEAAGTLPRKVEAAAAALLNARHGGD